jgi:hypothetical protein
MAFKSAQITLGNVSATQLIVQGAGATQFANIAGTVDDPLPVIVTNTDATIVIYVGGPGVTAATGTPVYPKTSFPMSLIGDPSISDIPFAIGASGAPVVAVLCGRQ